MKKVFYSKSFKDIKNIKKSFFSNNLLELKKVKKYNLIYSKQPIRKNCINCNFKLKNNIDFKYNTIGYKFCTKCHHLNGNYKETNKFNDSIYKVNKKKLNYGTVYKNKFNERVKKIYSPKLNFLKKVIKKTPNILDIGAGAGHFIQACKLEKINCYGIEISEDTIKYAPKSIKKKYISIKDGKDLVKIINEKKIDCVSLIHSLEHLINPNEILATFKKSNAKYLFLALPLFGLSCIIDRVFENFYPRVLGGGHTHFYTKTSLNYLIKKNKLRPIGEWWFGGDFFDLYRNMYLSLRNNHRDKVTFNYLDKYLGQNIDHFQKILDRNKLCDEIHILLRK